MGRRSGGAGAAGRCGHLCEGACRRPARCSLRWRSGEGGAGRSGAVQPDAPALAISGEAQKVEAGSGEAQKVEAGSGEAHEVVKVEAGSGEEQAEQKVSAYHFNVVVFRL